MIKQFGEQVRNYLILPAMSSIILCFVYYQEHDLPRLIVAGLFLLILFKQKQAVIYLSCFCSLTVWFACLRSEVPPIDQTRTTEEFLLMTDTIQRNGDWWTVTAQRIPTKQKTQLSYQAKTKKEAQLWEEFRGHPIELRVTGSYQTPETLRNRYAFDTVNYLKGARISGQFHGNDFQVLPYKRGGLTLFRDLRGKAINYVKKRYPKKIGMYMNALLFGFRDAAFRESETIFKATGLLHLFAVSGMHVHFYLGFLYYLFRRSGCLLSITIIPLTLLTGIYILLAGGSFSVVRAGSLFILKLVFKLASIKLSTLDCFSLNLWLLLLFDPLILLQTGGQLSIWLSLLFMTLPHSSKGWTSHLFYIFQISVILLPLSTWYFYEWSFLGGLFTTLGIPLFQYILLPGMVILFLTGSIIPQSLLEIIESCLFFFEDFLSYFDFSILTIGQPAFYFVLLSIVGLLLFFESVTISPWEKIMYSSPIIVSFFLIPLLDASTTITFIDVGQGDSILLKSPLKQEVVLVDTGGRLRFETEAWQQRITRPYAENNIVPYLKGQGITTITKLFLTHNDTDHIGELETLSSHFIIEEIYIGWGAAKEPKFRERLIKISQLGTKIIEVRQGDRISACFDLYVLMPSKEGQGKNEDSVVLWFAYKKQRFLLLGDLDQEGELDLLNAYPTLRAEVVKLGHHGSRSSSHPMFLAALQSKVGILSNGLDNRYGHPHPEVLETLESLESTVYRTDKNGAITFYWHPIWTKNGRLQKMID
ncbi:DNA internalization-related competence protein ComEC/Rec2 [Enterococcus mundtii]|uniref:DNA internalization-related competence protein ComEC/Rec2 n=1 Tax=Enterococcus mundtii TaxID=53346 RepID=UPI000D3BB607|nr:DNA internalization-related competence protein ComEC/Rec2 [Enterococcus mundtii]PTO40283.1 DNA internalization-related competence protein ComEC/Rec2 [Enterococcus mundtii]PTO44881.1 DNA internalization-related competence protein ComEC/Rec2 [Enterococcus mundtii]